MTKRALPLDEKSAPKRCSQDPEVFCSAHEKMVRSRAVGIAILGASKWAIPLLLTCLLTVIGFLHNNLATVEAKFDAANVRHEDVRRSVQAIEINLKHFMNEFDIEYITPEGPWIIGTL